MSLIRSPIRGAVQKPVLDIFTWKNGGVGSATPLRAASSNNYAPSGKKSYTVSSATTVEIYARHLFVVGADCTSLALIFPNWILRSNNGVENQTQYEVVEAAIEYNGTYTAVTFGGSAGVVVAPGANALSDEMPASGVSAAAFTKGSTGYTRHRIRITTPATDSLPNCGATRGTGSAGLKVDPTKVSFTRGVYSTSTFAYTMINGGVNGTDAVSDGVQLAPIVVGRHTGSAVGFWGDSKTYGTGDTAVGATGALGLNRALFPDATLAANAKPGINFGCPGGVASDATKAVAGSAVSSMTALYAYLTHAVVGYGTNGNGTTEQTALTDLHTQIRARGITPIIQRSLTPRTSSTDSWATTANQTLSAGWGVGSTAETYEAFMAAKVTTDANMTYYTSLGERAATSGADYWKWLVNGTANYATSDGLHEKAVGYEANITTGNVTTQGGTVSGSLRALVQAL